MWLQGIAHLPWVRYALQGLVCSSPTSLHTPPFVPSQGNCRPCHRRSPSSCLFLAGGSQASLEVSPMGSSLVLSRS